MTLGEYYTSKMDELNTMALNEKDLNLKIFYKNAAEGFKRRLENSKISDLEKNI